MRKTLFIFTGVLFFVYAGAQNEPMTQDSVLQNATEEEIFSVVSQMPEYPEGQAGLNKFITENLIYPQACVENSIQGTIVVSFVVEKDGSTSNHSIIRTVSYGGELNKEALRLCRLLRYKPGAQNGVQVRVKVNLPIEFNLREERKKQKNK
ncbi:MAG: energy transducer TonB [Flavobacteriales bacterium]|nr:energy transducer TonB [Flavobacteriales bacterium]